MNRTQQDTYFRKCLEALVASEIPKAQAYYKILENELSTNSVDGHLNMIIKLASGACLVKLGKDIHRSVRLLSEVVSAARSESDPYYLIEAQRYLGICLRNLGDFEAASNAFQQAINTAKQASKLDARLLISFGNVLGEIGQLYEAERVYEQALTYTKRPKDKLIEANILANLASLYERRARLMPGPNTPYDKAKSITYGSAALEIAKTLSNEETKSRFKSNLVLYKAMQSNSAANIEAIYDHIKLLRSINNLTSEALTWANLSMIYSQAGDANQAITCAETAIKISAEAGSTARQADSYFLLSKALELKGDMKSALNALKEHVRLNDGGNRIRAAQTGIVVTLQAALDEAQQKIVSTQRKHQADENFKIVATEILDSLLQGIALVSADGDVLYKNKVGAEMLAALPLDDITQFLAQSLKRKTVAHWNQKSIHVVIHPVNSTAKGERQPGEITQWLTLTSKLPSLGNPSAPLQHYNLNDIEKKIAGELLKGESTTDICVKFDIKIRALRAHLSSIYKKLGVSNQREAVAILIK
jgi:tetratricopeptide (TPR) repeat protein/DNA-binding CsgD family transcriptional regulator